LDDHKPREPKEVKAVVEVDENTGYVKEPEEDRSLFGYFDQRKSGAGWLCLIPNEQGTSGRYEFEFDEVENQEAPYSDDEWVYQFHVRIGWEDDYPKLEVVE
jgi:hypothetical protein